MIKQVFAAVTPVSKDLPPIDIPGPFQALLRQFGPGAVLSRVLASIFEFLLITAGLWSFIQLMLGGLAWISSQGDKAALEKARNQILYAVLGLLIIGASWGLIIIVQGALGICFGFGCQLNLNDIAPH